MKVRTSVCRRSKHKKSTVDNTTSSRYNRRMLNQVEKAFPYYLSFSYPY